MAWHIHLVCVGSLSSLHKRASGCVNYSSITPLDGGMKGTPSAGRAWLAADSPRLAKHSTTRMEKEKLSCARRASQLPAFPRIQVWRTESAFGGLRGEGTAHRNSKLLSSSLVGIWRSQLKSSSSSWTMPHRCYWKAWATTTLVPVRDHFPWTLSQQQP